MDTIINLKAYHEITDFISIDHGGGGITITKFNGRIHACTPGWANEIVLSLEQAEKLVKELAWRIKDIKKGAK